MSVPEDSVMVRTTRGVGKEFRGVRAQSMESTQ